MDWALFFASKLGRWLSSIVFTILLLGGTYWLGGHQREASITAEYKAAAAKQSKEIDNKLDTAERELAREFGLREVLRGETRKSFNDALIEYARKEHGSKNEGTACRNGISDDGVLLLNSSIQSRAREGRPEDAGKVRSP